MPISAYLLGTVLSEILPKPVKKVKLFRWDTLLIMFEIVVLFGVGLIPLTVSNHIVQIIINFICAMQQNTFRQAESIPMTTTLCTNHLRQFGVWGVKYLKNKDEHSLIHQKSHFFMICFFFLGGFLETIACCIFGEKAIWLVLFPLGINLFKLLRADLKEEKDFLEKIPLGH